MPFHWASSADSPEQSGRVSAEELARIKGTQKELGERVTAPWGKLLRLSPLWALLALHFSSNWFAYVMISWLPTYLTAARGFSLSSMAVGASLPYVSALLATNEVIFWP